MCTSQPEVKPKKAETAPIELAAIFQSLGPGYLEQGNLTFRQMSAFRNIVECRTAAKGGHRWKCTSCDHEVNQYNSCLDRHCPKCQGKARWKWVANQETSMINAPYFHLVFTLPHQLNPLIAFNPRPLLDLLFKAVSQTLLAFGRDPKHLGGELGFITVLHTWNQKLERHYHLHCIVPGGALSVNGDQWIHPKYDSYLFPEFALSETFRRLYWHGNKKCKGEDSNFDPSIPVFSGLKELLAEDSLHIPPSEERFSKAEFIQKLENSLYKQRWVVYAKRAFGGPTQVIRYLGCYTHRVAISNQRIVSHTNGMVTFSYKERKKEYRRRTLCLPESKFADRFLQHILPRGFWKVRSFGFLANRKKKKKIEQIHQLLGQPVLTQAEDEKLKDSLLDEAETESTSPELVCPHCQKPTLRYSRPVSQWAQHLIRRAMWDTS